MSGRNKIRLGIAILIAPIILIGLIFSVLSGDQTTLLMTLVLAALYAFYLYRFIPVLKKDLKQKKPQSPLERRK